MSYTPKVNKSDMLEYYVMALLSLGLPLVAFVYADWRAALTTAIFAHIAVGMLALRYGQKAVE